MHIYMDPTSHRHSVALWNCTNAFRDPCCTKQKTMELELVQRCCDLDAMRKTTKMKSILKMKMLWHAAYAMRAVDVPEMLDAHLEFLTELSYLTTLPAYRHIVMEAYVTILQRIHNTYQTFFAQMTRMARHLNTHWDELATDMDWEEWIETM